MCTPISPPNKRYLTRFHFDNPEVFNAINPHPIFGYFHGPVPDLNPGWKPRWYRDAISSGSLIPSTPISTSDIREGITSEKATLHPMSQLSKSSSMICDIIVGPNGEMCGHTFTLRTSFRLHLRMKHTGAVIPPPLGKTSGLQIETAENALKKWVLFGGWREALYLNEPGRGVGLIEEYCDALEAIANEDLDFAARFGTHFHRDIVHVQRNAMLNLQSLPKMRDGLFVRMDVPIREMPRGLAKSCPVTPVKAKCPRKSPSKSSHRKRKAKDSPLKGQTTGVEKKVAPQTLFRLSDNAERYLASVFTGGPIDSWNMLDQYHAIDEIGLNDVVYGDWK